jgi:hypothetical protein
MAFSGEVRSQPTPYTRGFHDRDRRETLIGDSLAERIEFELADDFVNGQQGVRERQRVRVGCREAAHRDSWRERLAPR